MTPTDRDQFLDDELAQTLILLAKTFVFLGEEIAASGGVTAQQWAVMHEIGAAGDAGLLPSKLAVANRTSRANVTRFIARLDRLGYLAVSPSPTDRRKKYLRLSTTGQAVLTKMDAEKRSRLDAALQSFASGERADLTRLAERLLRQLSWPRTGERPVHMGPSRSNHTQCGAAARGFSQ